MEKGIKNFINWKKHRKKYFSNSKTKIIKTLSRIKNYFENNFYKKFNFFKKEILYVDNIEGMNLLIKDLSRSEIIGIDTEFDWRKTYFPKLSLLQIAIGKKIYIVDCISKINLNSLKKFLEDPKKLIVFHSSRSDITVLKTNLNIKINNCFDIQIAEKFINGGEIKNYGSIVYKYCGYELNKSETNSNWLKRPLTDEQLKYAADDVNFLLFIHEIQLKKLKKLKKEKIINLEFMKEIRLGNQDLYISRLKKLKKASKVEKDIFLWREKYAEKKNLPPSYIFGNKVLKKIVSKIKSEEKEPNEFEKLFKDNSAAKDFLTYIKL